MKTNRPITLIAAAALAAASPVLANDSEAEWAVGGLELKANPDISMDSEDLYISPSEIRVTYRYTNHADTDREVLIAFPLPALPSDDEYGEMGSYRSDELSFETKVNGEPVTFEVHDRAYIGSRDVADLIREQGWSIHANLSEEFLYGLQDLPEEEAERLMELGLLKKVNDWISPTWKTQRSYLRRQVFPAGSSVSVTHRYTPVVGGSVGGGLNPNLSEYEGTDALADYREKWCVDDYFMGGIKRRYDRAKPGNHVFFAETWLGYVLSSGANWRGPITNFRLVVDKEDPNALVSFCMDGVTKISPTQFEVVKADFEPEGDLHILIARPHEFDPEGN